jgi:alanine dehydrogenase
VPRTSPRTSTFALTNATLPYALKLANLGFKAAVMSDSGLAEGVNTYAGKLTYHAVALSQGREYTALEQLLEA